MLRQLVRETLLAEKRMQPIGAAHLVKRLNLEVAKLLNAPGVLEQMQETVPGAVRMKYPEKAARMINDAMKHAADEASRFASGRQRSGYITASIEMYRILPNSDFRASLEKDIDDLVRVTARNYGWSILSAAHQSGSWRVLYYVLERNYGDKHENDVGTVYHLARAANVKSILKKGLLPKLASHTQQSEKTKDEKSGEQLKHGRQYSPRVYVTSSRDLTSELRMAFQPEGGEEYTLLRIDTSKLSRGTKFYDDAEFAGDMYMGESFWTYSRIPPRAISVDPKSAAKYEEFLAQEAEWDDDPNIP